MSEMEGMVFSAQQPEPPPKPDKPPDLGHENCAHHGIGGGHGVNSKNKGPSVSFRDKVLGNKQAPPVRERVDLLEKKLARIEFENGNRLLPKVFFHENMVKKLCSPWLDALVIKLLGKHLGYNIMKEKLKKLWRLNGGFDIMDVDNGFYMVKFDMAEDREKVVSRGPWMVFDHSLAITNWSPDFASPNAKIERTLVWIRFPGLNLLYYDENALMVMVAVVGKPIKVDHNTLKVERGKFARICVEIDLTQLVVGKVWLNGHWYKVEYEGLHLICASCGCYGHLSRNYTVRSYVVEDAGGSQMQPEKQSQAGKATVTEVADKVAKKKEPEKNKGITNNVETDIHGEWMIVSRKKKVAI